MLNSNRRGRYIPKPASDQTAEPVAQQQTDQDPDDIMKMIVDTLKMLSKNINELKQNSDRLTNSLKEMRDKIEEQAQNQEQVKLQFGQLNTKAERLDSEFTKVKADLESFKDEKGKPVIGEIDPFKKTYRSTDKTLNQVPMMPGAGFSSVTSEYLRSLRKD